MAHISALKGRRRILTAENAENAESTEACLDRDRPRSHPIITADYMDYADKMQRAIGSRWSALPSTRFWRIGQRVKGNALHLSSPVAALPGV
jgi:hypothetical protein